MLTDAGTEHGGHRRAGRTVFDTALAQFESRLAERLVTAGIAITSKGRRRSSRHAVGSRLRYGWRRRLADALDVLDPVVRADRGPAPRTTPREELILVTEGEAPLSRIIATSSVLCASIAPAGAAEPPYVFEDSIWNGIFNRVLTRDDPSHFENLSYDGRGARPFYAARRWLKLEGLYLFSAQYPGWTVKFPVHPDFGDRQKARRWVRHFATEIGRLPLFLLQRISAVEVSPCYASWSANGHTRTLHVNPRFGERLELRADEDGFRDDAVHEFLLHEGGHMLDRDFYSDPNYRAAQEADGQFITKYARDGGNEDVAETTIAWFALRRRPNRIAPDVRRLIRESIPNRLAYFDRCWNKGAC